jgi:hypothetical protein
MLFRIRLTGSLSGSDNRPDSISHHRSGLAQKRPRTPTPGVATQCNRYRQGVEIVDAANRALQKHPLPPMRGLGSDH